MSIWGRFNTLTFAVTNPSTPSFYPPASEAIREVANITERKNQHTPYMVPKNLSVCPSVTNFDPNYLTLHDQTQKPLQKSLQLWLPELFL